MELQRFKTMRLWITNTVEDQVWQSGGLDPSGFDFSLNNDSTYRVKIEGRLLDDEDELEKDADAEAQGADEGDKMDTDAPRGDDKGKQAKAQKPPQPRVSHFFKAMTVDFGGSKMRNGAEQRVEWQKPVRTPASANDPALDFDELTFKRNGDENTNIVINLYRDEPTERYQLSPELADIVDETVATRAEAVMGVWEYIKLMGLQEDEEKRHFRCDDLLKRVRAQGP